ncbi:MAG: fumarylacetoacetate hydrolase family protein [Flavobacteriales bacterium]|nr:fumarylacetoacetate hydrolase family protein [Flavobacteriales bacterium]
MKIICIGRNYVEHAKELNNPVPTKPMFFVKPDTALLRTHMFYIPPFSNNIHYELELVVKIKKVGKSISKRFAHKYYDEISLGLDLTARDLQEECKEKGMPWEIAKGFDSSAPIGKWYQKKDLKSLDFYLLKNGEKVQEGNPSQMVFDIDRIIEYVSKFMTLKKGDLIFTGTPSGVGKMETNDVFEAYLDGKKTIDLKVR